MKHVKAKEKTVTTKKVSYLFKNDDSDDKEEVGSLPGALVISGEDEQDEVLQEVRIEPRIVISAGTIGKEYTKLKSTIGSFKLPPWTIYSFVQKKTLFAGSRRSRSSKSSKTTVTTDNDSYEDGNQNRSK